MSHTVYVLNNLMGGIASFNMNLISRAPQDVEQTALLLTNVTEAERQISESLTVKNDLRVLYSENENVYAVLRRIAAAVPPGGGAVVSNSPLELAAFSRHRQDKAIFQVVHDEFNLRLSKKYEPIIDAFIAHSRYFYKQLIEAFPHRAESIFHRPYGIHRSHKTRTAAGGPLRLTFIGRLVEAKGVLDLPLIARKLSEMGISVRWTIIGDGPCRTQLQESLPPSESVLYASPKTNQEVLSLCAEGDALVFPTRFEGFPVALLEAMSAGLVPLVTALPSGVPEVVNDDTGYRFAVGDIDGYAAAIRELDKDRARLDQMSTAAAQAASYFDVAARMPEYHQLFARANDLKREWTGPLPIKHGSRLDQPFIPNFVVRTIRELVRSQESS